MLNCYLTIIDPKMHVLYRVINIRVGRPPWGKISSESLNMLQVPHLTRFNPFRTWAPWVRGNKKNTVKCLESKKNLDSGHIVSPSAFLILHSENISSLKAVESIYIDKLYPSLNGMYYSKPLNILCLWAAFCQIIW